MTDIWNFVCDNATALAAGLGIGGIILTKAWGDVKAESTYHLGIKDGYRMGYDAGRAVNRAPRFDGDKVVEHADGSYSRRLQ